MSKTGKLGRNPLNKLPARDFVPGSNPTGLEKVLTPSALEKIKEMDIQVDWTELYSSLVAGPLGKISKLSKFFLDH